MTTNEHTDRAYRRAMILDIIGISIMWLAAAFAWVALPA
jgi:hypothetical protein